MTHFISLKRSLALGLLSALLASLLTWVPNGLALDPILISNLGFSPTPNDQYEVYTGSSYAVSAEIYKTDVNSTLTFSILQLSGNVWLPTQIDTYDFQPGWNPVKKFAWDGKLNGNYVNPGTYKAQVKRVDANNNAETITHDFTVTEEAKITVNSAPNQWIMGGGDYKVDFTLKTVAPACVLLSVDGKAVDYASGLNSGNHSLSWDGKLNDQQAAAGEYDWKLDITDISFCSSEVVAMNAASGNVKVMEPIVIDNPVAPNITQLGVTVDPFSPNNDGNKDSTVVSFNLNADSTVTVDVYNSNNVKIRTLKDAQAMSAGNTEVVWNGKDSQGNVVADDEYFIAVMAKNAGGVDSDKVSVTVDNPAVVDPEESCAGFTDLPKDYAHCEVVEFVKNAGIMTGNANGTFAPNAPLQRDQVAKISLETFNLFNKNSDYCGGSPAFPDVPKSQWSYQYICRGADLGMIKGYTAGPNVGKYVPVGNVIRVEALALILRNLNEAMPGDDETSYKDVSLNQWFTGFARYAKEKGLYTGEYLYPTDEVTRLEMAQMIYKLDKLGKI